MTTLQTMVRIFSSSPVFEDFSENNPGILAPLKRGKDRRRPGVFAIPTSLSLDMRQKNDEDEGGEGA